MIWDEAVYIGIGKYIWSFGKIGLWENIRPIGLSLFLGFLWKLGLNSIFFSELLILFFAIGNILLIYFIAEKLFNKNIAIMSSLLLAVTPIFFYYSSFIFTGISSTFFALLAFYFFINKKLILAGVFSAITFLFRFPQGILLASLCIILLFNKNNFKTKIKNLFLLCSTFFIIILPFLISNFLMYKSYTSKFYHAILRPFILGSLHQNNPAHSVLAHGFWYNYFYYFIELFKNNYLLVFLILGIIFYLKQPQKELNLLFTTLLLYLIYFSYIGNKQLRFALVFLPYFCIISAYGLYNLLSLSKKQKHKIYIILALLIILFLFTFPIKTNFKQFKWRIDKEPLIVKEFYKFFSSKNIQAPILSTDPVFIAYNDVKLMPFYNNVDDAITILLDQSGVKSNDNNKILYEQQHKDVKYITYTDNFFPCQGNSSCENKKKVLLSMIELRNNLIFSRTYNNNGYYIFENPSFK